MNYELFKNNGFGIILRIMVLKNSGICLRIMVLVQMITFNKIKMILKV